MNTNDSQIHATNESSLNSMGRFGDPVFENAVPSEDSQPNHSTNQQPLETCAHNSGTETNSVQIPDIQVEIELQDSSPTVKKILALDTCHTSNLTNYSSDYLNPVPPSPGDSLDLDTVDSNLIHSNKGVSDSESLNTQEKLISLNDSNIVKYNDLLSNIHFHDLSLFDTNYLKNGLSNSTAEARLQKQGPNVIGGKKSIFPMWLVLLFRQAFTVLTAVLLFATILSAAVGDYADTGVIFAVIVINITIGFLQEYKSESTMAKLKDLTAPMSKVIRGGEQIVIPSRSLVVGDIVVLKEGDRIPADLRVSESVNLSCLEALLTGESVPIDKTINALVPSSNEKVDIEMANTEAPNTEVSDNFVVESAPEEEEVAIPIPNSKQKKGKSVKGKISSNTIPLGDRINMAYMSTTITSGRGKGIVIATGSNTEIGKIAKSLGENKSRTTPLQRKMNLMGLSLMLIAAIALVIVVISVGLHKGWDSIFPDAFMIGVAVAVAIIPESLVAVVTLTLSSGVRKMAIQNAIVRKLAALETLGSIQHICSDKTGTLTEGKMVVNSIWTPTNSYSVDTILKTQEIFGSVTDNESSQVMNEDNMPENLKQLLYVATLCTNSSISLVDEVPKEKKEWKIQKLFKRVSKKLSGFLPKRNKSGPVIKKVLAMVGEPTELALTSLSIVTSFTKDSPIVMNTYPEKLYEFPFNSTIKRMSVLYKYSEDTAHLLAKGASEGVLDLCTRYLKTEGGMSVELTLDEEMKSEITSSIENLAKRGLRVLCIAFRSVPLLDIEAEQLNRDEFEKDFTFIGLVGIQDPPRREVANSIKICEEAGITVHMLTGDHYLTAKAISEQVGIINESNQSLSTAVMEAKHFDTLSPEELRSLESLPFVIARCSPQSKVKMIEALHARKKMVAMTGDGVNDAPSIKLADIGIAMGKGGSDVTKEAADIVLTDDNFSTIVTAIREGRRIFSNLRKFITHLLSANVAQLISLLIPVMIGYEVPLNATQILWLNMITGTPTALSLGIEKASKKVMKRSRKNALFNGEMLLDLFVYGFCMSVVILSAYFLMGPWWLNRPLISCQSVAFSVFTVMLVIHAYNCRHKRKRFWEDGALQSYWLHAAILLCIGLQFFILYVPWVNSTLFHQVGLKLDEWIFVIVGTIVFMISAEIWKGTKSTFTAFKASFLEYWSKRHSVKKLENSTIAVRIE